MGKVMKWLIVSVSTVVGIVVLLLVGGFCMLNTSSVQQKLLNKATVLLKEKLKTNVSIDSVSIDLLTLDAELFGLSIDDLQQRKMLSLEFLRADVDIMKLMKNEIVIPEIRVKGIQAELHKVPKDSLSPDTVANYQFIIDAFKSDKKKPKTKQPADKKKGKLALTVSRVKAEDIGVRFNKDSVYLGLLEIDQDSEGMLDGKIANLHGQWERFNKKGELVTNNVLVTEIEVKAEDGEQQLNLHRVNFRTNNHKPRKNAGKPKRGFFDVGHFNIWADMKLAIDRVEKGTVHGWLREFTAQDTITGLDITKLQCELTANKEGMRLEDVVLKQKNTELHFVRADLKFPNKKTGKKLSYFTSTIGGTVYLQDISRMFAPVLRNFKIPLNLSVRMDGDAEGMRFHDVVVTRPNGLVNIKAKGSIVGLKNKYDLHVHFDVKQAVIKGNEKELLINQFVVKKFMMKQLNALGTLIYTGSFDVVYKKEMFRGLVRTAAGSINFDFSLDELNKYVYGHAAAKQIELGKVMDMPDLGPVTASADFKFDISKPRTAIMRRKLGGKLPIGEVTAHVEEAKYGLIKARNVYCKIVSNGAIAEGMIKAPGSFATLSCTFSFTNTNEMKKTKIKPGIRFNLFGKGKSEEEKLLQQQQKEAERQRKAAEKAQKRAVKEAQAKEKAARKAAEKAAKEQEKAARKQEKEARKAAEEKEKAARKAAKEQEKAARKAAKKAEKEARKAAKEAAKAAKQ